MKRPMIATALVALGVLALSIVPASAQQQPTTVIVPAPSASPPTVVTPAPTGTTVVVPPGSTVTVTPPPATVAVRTAPWCNGAYSTLGGSNFGACPGHLSR